MKNKNDNENWHLTWEVAEAPIFEMSHGTTLAYPWQEKLTGLIDKDLLLFATDHNLAAYYSTAGLKKAALDGLKKFSDSTFAKNFFSSVKTTLEEDKKLLSRLESLDIERLDIEELVSLFQEHSQYERRIFALFNGTNPQFIKGLEEKVRDYLNGKVDSVDTIYPKLATSARITTLNQEQVAWLKIIKQAQKQVGNKRVNRTLLEKNCPDLWNLIVKHQKQYGLLAGSEGNEPWDINHFVKILTADLGRDLNTDEELKKLRLFTENAEKDRQEIISKYKISQEIQDLTALLAELGHWRLELRLAWTATFHFLRDILKFIADKRDVPYDVLVNFTVDEIVNSLKDRKKGFNDADNRAKAYLYLIRNLKVNLYIGAEALEKKKQLLPDSDLSGVEEFKGNVACQGKVRGKVFVFHWGEKDFNKRIYQMPKGAILVAGQTRPILMPAIRIASAIVTDEGGIMSHAAIVSRELNIPCVIGSKIATKVLRDGDEIEVDAEKGVIKILNRA